MMLIYFSASWKALLFHCSLLTLMFKREIVAYVSFACICVFFLTYSEWLLVAGECSWV